MKTSSEYRAAAWKEWRAQMSQSSIIILLSMIVGMVSVSALYGSFLWYTTTHSMVAASITLLIAIAVIFTVSLLNYFVPVWFLTLVRKQQKWYEVRTSYGRALLTAWVILLPTVVQEAVSMPMNMTNEPSVIMSLVFLAVMPAVVLFIIWWTYAIGTTLPFRVLDHPDRSVFQAIKENIRMMNGYKFQLFCVDFMIMIWPIVGLCVLLLFMAICMVFVVLLNPGTNMIIWLSIGLGLVMLPFVVVYGFIFEPMLYIAHAQFYDDLRAEKELNNR